MNFKIKFQRLITIFTKRDLEMLIFFVTSRCNSRCETCFYWKSLNKQPDLSLSKINEISKNLGKFKILLLSGGEPFLRNDLSKIAKIFVKNNKIEMLSIPTNGLLTKKIVETTHRILLENPNLNVSLNFSLDGLEKTHNEIRGVRNNFQTATETIKKLTFLKTKFPKLNIVVNTVICRKNYGQIEKLALFLKNNFALNGHFFEIARGRPKDEKILTVPPEELAKIYQKVFPLQTDYFNTSLKKQNLGQGIIGWLRKLIREEEFIGSLLYQYKTQFNNYAFGGKWSIPCRAGELIKVLDSDGKIKDCELRKKKGKTCYCTHVCFINISSQFNWKTYFFEFPYLYLKYKIVKKTL